MAAIKQLAVKLQFDGSYEKTDGLTAIVSRWPQYDVLFRPGTGVGQLNHVYYAVGTASATPTNYDIVNALTDAMGDAFVLSRLKLLFVTNLSAISGRNITLSGNALLSLGIVASFLVHPGGFLLLTFPHTGTILTAASQDTLTLTASANAGFNILIGGI